MTVPEKKIVDAAQALVDFRLRGQVGATTFSLTPREVHAIMVLVEASPQIAKAFGECNFPSKVQASSAVRVVEGITLPEGYDFTTPFYGERGIFKGLSKRVENNFRWENLKTVGDLARRTCGIQRVPNLGLVSLAKIKEGLRQCGFDPEEFWCLQNPGVLRR
ncbi:hypothetical protein K2Q16_04715 [Patescibacteria group bacterium]|nr:hypothetical protein [Patescibacteria group bacterium]